MVRIYNHEHGATAIPSINFLGKEASRFHGDGGGEASSSRSEAPAANCGSASRSSSAAAHDTSWTSSLASPPIAFRQQYEGEEYVGATVLDDGLARYSDVKMAPATARCVKVGCFFFLVIKEEINYQQPRYLTEIW